MEKLSSVFNKRIGNTLFLVNVKSAEKAKKQYEEKLKEIIKKEMKEPYFLAQEGSA